MEMSVAQGENRSEPESAAPASNSSSESMVKIDGLYVGIDGVLLPDASGIISHFSIREYVAEMRRKNKGICAPFETEITTLLDEQMFPMEIPKHRYWRCNPCPRGICSSPCPTKEMVVVSESCPNGWVSDGTCSNMALVKDAGATPCELLNDTAAHTINLTPGCTKYQNIKDKSCASSSSYSKQATTDDNEKMAFTSCGSRAQSSDNHHGHETVSPNFSSNELVDPPLQYTTGSDTNRIWYPIPCRSKKRDTSELERGNLEALPSDITTRDAAKVSVPVRSTRVVQLEDEDDSSTDSDEMVRSIDHRRKTKKVRLLTDLLGRKGSSRRDRIVEDSPATNAEDTISSELGVVVAAAARGPPEDVEKFKQRLPSKRRMSNFSNSEVRGLSNVSKKVRSTRVNMERPNLTWEAFRSEAEVGPLSKKYHDKLQSSLTQLNDDLGSRRSHAASASMHTSSVALCGSSEMDKGNNLVIEIGKTSVSPVTCSTLGDVLDQRKQIESLRDQSARNPSQLENNGSIRVGLDLSLGASLSSDEGSAEGTISMTNATLIEQKDKPSRFPYCKGKQVAGDSGILINSSPHHSVKKGLQWDLNERIEHDTTLSIDKQTNSAPLEYREPTVQGMMVYSGDAGDIAVQENDVGKANKLSGTIKVLHGGVEDLSGPSLKEKNVEVHGHSGAIKKQSGQRTGKAVEQGTPDDIPMDVIEMLAQNQYARRIQIEQGFSAGQHHSLSNRSDTIIRGTGDVHGNGPRTWLQREIPGMANNPHAGHTNGMVMQAGVRLSSERNESMAQFFRWGCLDGQRNHFSGSAEHLQKLSTSTQFPVSSSRIIGPQPSEAAQPAWLPKIQNMPSTIDLSKRYPSILSNKIQHKGITISDIRGEDWKVQNKKLEGSHRPGIGELNPKPRPSFDQYSNESISAMQLLSLMENGMSSDPAFIADANRLAAKPFPPSGYQALSINERSSCTPMFAHQQERPVVYGAVSSSLYSQTDFRFQQQGESRKWASNIQHRVGASGNLHISPLPGLSVDRQNWGRQNVGPSNRSGRRKDRQSWDKGKELVGVSYPGKILRPGSGKDGQNQDQEKCVASTSDTVAFQLQISAPIIDVEAYAVVSETSLPSRRPALEEHCLLNRNPAEFSSPELGNEYTISGRDIQLRREPSRRTQEGKVRRFRKKVTVTKGRDNARRRAS